MPLRFIALKPLPRLYRLLPLMPIVFLVILLFAAPFIPLLLFDVLLSTLLFVLIAFNLVLILQYGFTLSKLIGDTTTPKLLLASLVATYTVMLVLVIATFSTGEGVETVETVFTVIRLTALIGAIPVAVAIIASRSSALIAIATLTVLTAITLLATAVLSGLEGTGLADTAGLVLFVFLTTLQFITLYSLLNQPFALIYYFVLFISDFIHESLYEFRSVAFGSWSGLIIVSILLVFAYTPGILSLATLSWLAYRAYKATGNVGFKRVALILMLEIVVPFILLPQLTIPIALAALANMILEITQRPSTEEFREFYWLLLMATMLVAVVQAAKWYIAIRPLEDSQAATHSSSTHSQLGESRPRS